MFAADVRRVFSDLTYVSLQHVSAISNGVPPCQSHTGMHMYGADSAAVSLCMIGTQLE